MSDGAPTPLRDLRVVEISDRIAGAYCGKLFVDAGADVVKVEPAAGDPLRRFTATGAKPAEGSDSPLFSYLSAGKRSVTTLSEDLLAAADIVIVTGTRSAATAHGIDPARLLGARPDCVIVTISDFGWTGPWSERPATEFTLQADCGAHRLSRRPRGPADLDRRGPGRVHGRNLGSVRRNGTAPPRRARRPGRAPGLVHAGGDHVDAEQRMAALAASEEATRQTLGGGAVDRARQGRLRGHQHGHRPAVAGLRRNGRLSGLHRDSAVAVPDRAMGLPRLDPRTDRPVDARADSLGDRRARTALPAAAGAPGQRFHDPGHGPSADAWRLYPQSCGIPATAGTVAHVDRSPGTGSPCPAVGEADDVSLWAPRQSVPRTRSAEAPLAGVRVIDFTAFWAGPAAAHALAALGADVVKIESIQRPDGIRYSGECAPTSTTGGSTAGCSMR